MARLIGQDLSGPGRGLAPRRPQERRAQQRLELPGVAHVPSDVVAALLTRAEHEAVESVQALAVPAVRRERGVEVKLIARVGATGQRQRGPQIGPAMRRALTVKS
jgi:hypothetical protein